MNGNRNFIIDKERAFDNVCKQFFSRHGMSFIL